MGEWFRGVASELGARVARVPGEAKRIAEAGTVTLRLASTHALSFTFLPRWLRGLESSMALGPVQLVSDVLQGCEQLMLQGRVQFVLSHTHPNAPGALDVDAYRSARIGQDVLIPVSQPDAHGGARHRLVNGKGPDVPVLRYGEESGLGRIVHAVLGRRLEGVAVKVVFTAHLASVLRTMVLDGRGVAWLPRTLIEDDIREGRVVKAASAEWEIPLAIRLYRERELIGRAAQAFWESVTSGGDD